MLLMPIPMRVPSGPPRNLKWTVEQFHYLGDLGCFEGRRAMLIDGVIIEEGPMNPPPCHCWHQIGRADSRIIREGLARPSAKATRSEPSFRPRAGRGRDRWPSRRLCGSSHDGGAHHRNLGYVAELRYYGEDEPLRGGWDHRLLGTRRDRAPSDRSPRSATGCDPAIRTRLFASHDSCGNRRCSATRHPIGLRASGRTAAVTGLTRPPRRLLSRRAVLCCPRWSGSFRSARTPARRPLRSTFCR